MAIDAAQLRVVVSADTRSAEGDLKSFSGKMKGAAGGLSAAGALMGAAIVTPLIGIGVSAVKTAATFEKSMNVLGYVTEGTSAQMQAMSDQALQLGADTVFSANEAAEGMVELAKAGMDTEDVMGAIPGVMDLAAAGQISVAEAAGLTAATLNTFGLAAEDSTKVADVLAAAANASSADIRDLAFGVQNAGSVFASSGQSVETLATMMALLANNGLNASDAATSLKTMTMRLTAPTDKAAKVMKELGIEVFDSAGSMREYEDIIEDLEASTKSLSDEQRSAALNTIFGADAIRAAIILANEGNAGFEAMNTAVQNQGAAAEMAAAQNTGLAGALEQISGSIETVFTKLALPFLDEIATAMGHVTALVNKIGELPQPVVKAALAFLGFAIVVGAAAAAIATLSSAAVWGALTSTVGLVSLALLGLGLAVAVAWAMWETNFGNIQQTLDPFKQKFLDVKAAVEDFFRYLATAVSEGDLFNAWLLSVPEDFVPFAEAVAGGLIAVKDFSTQTGQLLLNLGSYFLAVALGAAALNIWLFTLPEGMQEFALGVGEGITAVKEFATETGTLLSNLGQYFLAVALGAAALNIWIFTLPPQMQSFALSVGEAIVGVKAKVEELKTALQEVKMPDLANFGTSTLNTDIQMGLVVAFKEIQLDWSTLTWSTDILVTQVGVELSKITWGGLVADFSGLVKTVGDYLTKESKAALGEDNIVTRTIKRVGDALTTIQTEYAGLDLTDPIAAVNSIFAMAWTLYSTFTGIKTDVLTTAVTGIEQVATAILNFGSQLVKSIDAEALADAAGSIVTGLSDQIVKLASPEQLGDLGGAAGTLVSTIITKLGEFLGAKDFGTDVGTAIGKASVAIANGANTFALAFTNALADTPWGQFSGQLTRFVGGLVTGMISQIGPALWEASIFNPETRKEAVKPENWWADSPMLQNIFGGLAEPVTAELIETGTEISGAFTTLGTTIREGATTMIRDLADITFATGAYGPKPGSVFMPSLPDVQINPNEPDFGADMVAKITQFNADVSASIQALGGDWLPEIDAAFTSADAQILESITGLAGRIGAWITEQLGKVFGAPGGVTAQEDPGSGFPPYPGGKGVGLKKMMTTEERAAVDAQRAAADAAAAPKGPDWVAIITPPDWIAIILPPDWAAVITPPDWSLMIPAFDWEKFVIVLAWNEFITSLQWEAYVTRLGWESFVSDIAWSSYIPDVSWGSYIPAVDWGRYIPRLGATADPIQPSGSTTPGFDMGGASGGINIVVNVASLNNDWDIETLANKVATKFRQKMR